MRLAQSPMSAANTDLLFKIYPLVIMIVLQTQYCKTNTYCIKQAKDIGRMIGGHVWGCVQEDGMAVCIILNLQYAVPFPSKCIYPIASSSSGHCNNH